MGREAATGRAQCRCDTWRPAARRQQIRSTRSRRAWSCCGIAAPGRPPAARPVHRPAAPGRARAAYRPAASGSCCSTSRPPAWTARRPNGSARSCRASSANDGVGILHRRARHGARHEHLRLPLRPRLRQAHLRGHAAPRCSTSELVRAPTSAAEAVSRDRELASQERWLMFELRSIDAGYGGTQVLRGVDLVVPDAVGRRPARPQRRRQDHAAARRLAACIRPTEARCVLDGEIVTGRPPHALCASAASATCPRAAGSSPA